MSVAMINATPSRHIEMSKSNTALLKFISVMYEKIERAMSGKNSMPNASNRWRLDRLSEK
jgi:hypothetical protein